MKRQPSHGFTLVELLVAITIFSVMAAMAYGGLSSVLRSERAIDQAATRLGELQRTMLFLTRDLAQLVPRGIRNEYGDQQPPLQSQGGALAVLEFTRGGWSNPAGQARSTLQRIGYGVEEQQLVRYSWPVLDRASDSQPWRTVMLTGVEAIKTRFMDEAGAWQESWPPVGGEPAAATTPRAVEVSLTLEGVGEVRRLFVTEAAIPPLPAQGGTPATGESAPAAGKSAPTTGGRAP